MAILVLQQRVALPIGLMRRTLQARFPKSTWRVGDEDWGGNDEKVPLSRPMTVLGRNTTGQAMSCIELRDDGYAGSDGDCPPAHRCHITVSRPTIEDDDLARAISLVIATSIAVQQDESAWLQLAPGENWLDTRDMRALLKLLPDDPALRRRGEYGMPPGRNPIPVPAGAAPIEAPTVAAKPAPTASERPVLGSFSIIFDRSPRIDWDEVQRVMNALDPEGRWSVIATPSGLGFAQGRTKIFLLWGTNYDAHGQGYDATEIGQALRRSQPFDGDLRPLGGRTQRVTLRIERPEGHADKVATAKATTLMLGLVARSAGAVAVLNDVCGTIFTPARVAALVSILGSDEIPIELWTWTAPNSLADGDVSLTTSGLAAFLGYELEVWNAPLEVDAVADKLSGVLRYLLINGPVIGHGETIGADADDRSVRCFFGTSRADRPEPVEAMFLEFDLDPPAMPKKDLPLPPSLRPDAPRAPTPASSLLRRPATFGRKGSRPRPALHTAHAHVTSGADEAETAMKAMLAVALMAQAAAPAGFVPPDPAARVTAAGDVYGVLDAGCVARPIDDGLRQRLLDVAAGEWARFGYPIYDLRAHDRRTVNVPHAKALLPKRLNPVQPGIARTMARVGEMEDDRPIRAAIAGYWSVVPNGAEVLAQQNAVFALYRGSGWVQPWSAAFISYVECAAGVADPDQFVRSDGHFRYVDQAIATAAGIAAGANPVGVYAARDLDSGLPTPGDLLCADRAPPPNYRRIADRADTNQRNMHCDLVVKVVTGRRGYIALIGGNVINAATMTLVNIVPKKGKVPAHVESAADAPGGRPWFAILALRAGGKARLEDTPAVRALGAGVSRSTPSPRP